MEKIDKIKKIINAFEQDENMESYSALEQIKNILEDKELKEYEVVIDLGSKTFRVKAENEKEAKEKAMFEFEALSCDDKIEEYWIGDIEEVQE